MTMMTMRRSIHHLLFGNDACHDDIFSMMIFLMDDVQDDDDAYFSDPMMMLTPYKLTIAVIIWS